MFLTKGEQHNNNAFISPSADTCYFDSTNHYDLSCRQKTLTKKQRTRDKNAGLLLKERSNIIIIKVFSISVFLCM